MNGFLSYVLRPAIYVEALPWKMLYMQIMAIGVVEFSREGYKIRKVFA